MRYLMFILILGFSNISSANLAVQDHLLGVSHTLASFYMYKVSDGGESFLEDFKEFKRASVRSAQLTGTPEIIKRWQDVRESLAYSRQKKFSGGYELVSGDQTKSRKYLSYLYTQLEPLKNASINERLDRILALSSLLIVRAIDVHSSYNGREAIAARAQVINEEAVFNTVMADINRLKLQSNHPQMKKSLERLHSKLQFIGDTVSDYSKQPAIYFAYVTMLSVDNLVATIKFNTDSVASH
jgi:hypothetical protein